jgi:hypothetical protein
MRVKYQPESIPASARWDHLTVTLRPDADLSEYCAQGWELIAAIPMGCDRAAFHFKRRR